MDIYLILFAIALTLIGILIAIMALPNFIELVEPSPKKKGNQLFNFKF